MGVEAERLILNFHGIGEPRPEIPADERPYWCPAALFPELLDAALAAAREGGCALEITFDDGNLSDLEAAVPALAARALGATFFVCAGRIGEPHYLGAEDLRAMAGAGMEIGSHGWGHIDLRRADDATLARETTEARARIADALGAPVERFAIPFGSYDRRVLRSLRGFRAVYSSDNRRARAGSWLSPRCSYERGWSAETIRQKATERYSLKRRLRQMAGSLVKRLR